jgi:REP element-mobilizing transposase RayT
MDNPVCATGLNKLKRHFHRRNLPHLYFDEGKYFVTYRLANSIPVEKLKEIKSDTCNPDFNKFKRLFQKYDSLLDTGDFGINYLKDKRIADICKGTIHYPDGKDYKLICYCIMSNHIHLVFDLLTKTKDVGKIMQAVKGISAKEANKILNRKGKFWQDAAKRSLCEKLRPLDKK